MAGQGSAPLAMLVVLRIVCNVAATTYVVSEPGTNGGDWTYVTGNTSYDDIFKNTKLFVGDTLSFTFATNVHDVALVAPAAVAPCDISNPIQKYTASVNVTLQTAGEHGFICSYFSHCSEYGMHLLVSVLDAPASSPGGGPAPDSGAPGNAASFLRSGSSVIVGALILLVQF